MLAKEQETKGLTRIAIDRINEIKNEFRTAHYQQEAERKYNKMMMVRHLNAYNHRKQELINLFNESDIPCNENMTDAELHSRIQLLPGQEDMEALLLERLRRIYKLFPASNNFMERIVRRLGDPDFQNETVRVAIVKQFMRHTDYETGDFKRSRGKIIDIIRQVKNTAAIEDAKEKDSDSNAKYERYREAMISCFDEKVFQLYDMTYKNLKKKEEREKFNLLKLADGLANGKFWMNFGTRRDLYLFAFAFGMRAYPDKNVDDYDKTLDIEENLFFDFYADNLLRSLTVTPGTEEREPSGEGINYKNFAEIIYLYYLNQKELKAGEKIKKADKIIEECIKKVETCAKKNGDSGAVKHVDFATGEDTNAYKEHYYIEVMHLDEAQLADYIVAHYDIPDDVRAGSRIAVASKEITATKKYVELRNKLIDLLADDKRLADSLKAVFIKTGDTEIDKIRAKDISDSFGDGASIGIEMQDIQETLRSISEEAGDDEDFVKILTNLDKRLKMNLSLDAVLHGEERMTRTHLITLHYLNYVNEMAEEEEIHQVGAHVFVGEGKSLSEIYDDFVDRVDTDLEEARYQKISPKNIFDMFVIFMLYRYFALI